MKYNSSSKDQSAKYLRNLDFVILYTKELERNVMLIIVFVQGITFKASKLLRHFVFLDS